MLRVAYYVVNYPQDFWQEGFCQYSTAFSNFDDAFSFCESMIKHNPGERFDVVAMYGD